MHAQASTACVAASRPLAASCATRRRMFTPNHIALAAVIGAPLGGSIVMAVNFARRGRSAAAMGIMTLGAAASAVLLAMTMMFSLPIWVGGMLGVAFALAIRTIAQRRQIDSLDTRTRSSADASVWSAVGIALAALLLRFVVLIGVLVAMSA